MHRVGRQHLVPYREFEREPQDDARLLGAVVGDPRLLLDEAVTARHPDLAQGQVLEHRQHEGAHVPLVQNPSRPRNPVLEVEVLKPVRDEVAERAVRRQVAGAGCGLELRASRQLLLQCSLGCLGGVGGGLHDA